MELNIENFKDLKDICNTAEFGLFHKCVTSKTCQLKSGKCLGGKLSKVCLTGIAAANVVGGKIPMFVVGKAQKPRCLRT